MENKNKRKVHWKNVIYYIQLYDSRSILLKYSNFYIALFTWWKANITDERTKAHKKSYETWTSQNIFLILNNVQWILVMHWQYIYRHVLVYIQLFNESPVNVICLFCSYRVDMRKYSVRWLWVIECSMYYIHFVEKKNAKYAKLFLNESI